MKNNIKTFFRLFLSKVLNKFNFNKFIAIFIVGFISRILVAYFYSLNVCSGLLSPIFISFNICTSTLIILIPEFSIDVYTFILKLCNSYYCFNYKIFGDRKLDEFKVSSFKQVIKGYNFKGLKDKIIIASNINEMKPYREIGLSNKSSYSHPSTRSLEALSFQEKDKFITKCKKEFKEFYTTYRESIKLSDWELEKLNIKIAIIYYKDEGDTIDKAMEILPNHVQPFYKDFIRKQFENSMKANK